MKESKTTYAYLIEHMQNPSFQKIWDIACNFVRKLSEDLSDELFKLLNKGMDVLDSEPLLLMYIYSYGNMHNAKLQYAFSQLRNRIVKRDQINIIDYGCGQGLASICYQEFIKSHNPKQKVNKITLIDPSPLALSRAELLCSRFYPDAEILAINKTFDDLTVDDIIVSSEELTLHLFSNIIDVESYDLSHLIQVVKELSCVDNEYVIVSPIQNATRTKRLKTFASSLGGHIYFENYLDKRQLNKEKDWTCSVILCSQQNTDRSDCDKELNKTKNNVEKVDTQYCWDMFHQLVPFKEIETAITYGYASESGRAKAISDFAAYVRRSFYILDTVRSSANKNYIATAKEQISLILVDRLSELLGYEQSSTEALDLEDSVLGSEWFDFASFAKSHNIALDNQFKNVIGLYNEFTQNEEEFIESLKTRQDIGLLPIFKSEEDIKNEKIWKDSEAIKFLDTDVKALLSTLWKTKAGLVDGEHLPDTNTETGIPDTVDFSKAYYVLVNYCDFTSDEIMYESIKRISNEFPEFNGLYKLVDILGDNHALRSKFIDNMHRGKIGGMGINVDVSYYNVYNFKFLSNMLCERFKFTANNIGTANKQNDFIKTYLIMENLFYTIKDYDKRTTYDGNNKTNEDREKDLDLIIEGLYDALSFVYGAFDKNSIRSFILQNSSSDEVSIKDNAMSLCYATRNILDAGIKAVNARLEHEAKLNEVIAANKEIEKKIYKIRFGNIKCSDVSAKMLEIMLKKPLTKKKLDEIDLLKSKLKNVDRLMSYDPIGMSTNLYAPTYSLVRLLNGYSIYQ